MWRIFEKTKKPKLFGEVLVSGQKMFFFGFPWVFFVFFWFRFLKTKKNLGFFWFFEGSLSWRKAKNQKNSRFFCFFGQMFRRNVWRIHEKNKTTWVFLVFCLSSTKASFKKPKKTKFFLVFKNLNQKETKNLKENQKKTIFRPETKTSPKSFVFLVVWFSRGFVT